MIEKIKKTLLEKKEAYIYDYFTNTKKVFSEKIQTMGVDRNGSLYISPTFVEKLSDDELVGVLYHEALHIVYGHNVSKKDNHYLINVAGDIFINEQIISIGMVLPKGVCLKSTFNVPDYINTCSEIYTWLEQNLTDEQKQKLSNQNKSELEKLEDLFENAPEELKKEISEIIKEFSNKMSEKINKTLKVTPEQPVKWDIDLTSEVGRLIKRTHERNYRRPARYEPKGIIRPNFKKNIHVPKINMYVDKSGSMQGIFGVVVASLKEVKQKLKSYIPTYYVFDTEITEVKPEDLENIEASGGTVFSEIKGNADLHIIITDGELDYNYIDSNKNIIVYEIKNNEIKRRVK